MESAKTQQVPVTLAPRHAVNFQQGTQMSYAPTPPSRVTLPVPVQVRYVHTGTPSSPPPRMVPVPAAGSPTMKVVKAIPSVSAPMPAMQNSTRTSLVKSQGSAVPVVQAARLHTPSSVAQPPGTSVQVVHPSPASPAAAGRVATVSVAQQAQDGNIEVPAVHGESAAPAAEPMVVEETLKKVAQTPAATVQVVTMETLPVPRTTDAAEAVVEQARPVGEPCKLLPSVGTWHPHVTAKQLECKTAPAVGDLVEIVSTSNTEKYFREGVGQVFRIANDARDSQPYQVATAEGGQQEDEAPFDVWLFKKDVRMLSKEEVQEVEKVVGATSHGAARTEAGCCFTGVARLFVRSRA